MRFYAATIYSINLFPPKKFNLCALRKFIIIYWKFQWLFFNPVLKFKKDLISLLYNPTPGGKFAERSIPETKTFHCIWRLI
jgi:hypothetical protein